MPKKRYVKRPSDICLDKDKPVPQVKIIVPPGIKVQRFPGISREDYFSGDNYYFKRQKQMFS